MKKYLDPKSHKLDQGLQRMMRKRLGNNFFPSPAPATLFHSLAATEWAFAYLRGEHPNALFHDAWVSCIAGRPGSLLAHLPTSSLVKVVGCAEFGILVWHMGVSSESTFFMRPDRFQLQWMHITDMDAWVYVPCQPFVTTGMTIQWVKSGNPVPLPVALVQNGISITVAQIKRLMDKLGICRKGCNDRDGLHQLLMDNILASESDKKAAKDAYAEAGKDVPLDSDLEDVISCLDAEDANDLDLKELKEKKKKKRYQKKKDSTAANNQQVPDSEKKRGRGRGRGRGRSRGGEAGRGRGRGKGRGRGRIKTNFLKRPEGQEHMFKRFKLWYYHLGGKCCTSSFV